MDRLEQPQVKLPTGAELATRLETEGFLVLPCHTALEERIAALWDAGRAFFTLPHEVRRRNVLAAEYDGYHDIGQEFSAVPDRPDLAEAFWTRLIYAGETRRFPDEAARAVHRASLAVCREMERLLEDVTVRLARHYGGPDGYTFRCDQASHLQFNHYEPRAQTRELLQDPHEDGLYVTLWRADAPGLEIQALDGSWHPVRLGPGELLAMPGEIMSLLCGCRVPPLYHRVRNHPEIERRFSMMYFSNPNPSPALRPWIANEANAGIDILERAATNPTRYGLPPLPPV